MRGWDHFAAAALTFLLTHLLPTRPVLRQRLMESMGPRSWYAAYGIVSLLATAWLIAAAGWAPFVELWPQVPWTRWAPNLLMPLAILLAVLGLPARTTTLGGPRPPALDPQRPGFAAVTRHPLLWALALWSLSHLGPNGDLAHVLLFGGFAALALLAMPVFDRRARRVLPPAFARDYFGRTAILSARPLLSSRFWREALRPRRLVLALLLWGLVLLLHPWVVGASPLPH